MDQEYKNFDLNKEQILSILKSGESDSRELLHNEIWNTSGYFLGFVNNQLFLSTAEVGKKMFHVHVRPYSLKYLMEVIKPELGQLLEVECKGIRRAREGKEGEDFRRNYIHMDFRTRFKFAKFSV